MEKTINSNLEYDNRIYFDVFEGCSEKTASKNGVADYMKEFLKKDGVDKSIYEFLKSDKFKPNKEKNGYLIMSAMGAEEVWGSNMNYDAFKRKELKKSFKSFENGHAFEQHKNDDPEKAVGKILFSIYNDKMDRVELVVEVFDKDGAGSKFMKKLWQVSMGTKIDYDECSICGNKAKTKKDYCTHIKNELGKVYPDGRKVVMINVGCRFFDISFVRIAADLTGRTLEVVKVASKNSKGAEINKEVEGNIQPYIDEVSKKFEEIKKDVYSGKKVNENYSEVAEKIKKGEFGIAKKLLEKISQKSSLN